MWLIVFRSGGFAGLRRQWRLNLDDVAENNGLPEVSVLLEELFVVSEPPNNLAADRFVFEFSCDDRAIEVPETQLNSVQKTIVQLAQENPTPPR